MDCDIDPVLKEWAVEPGATQARLVTASDGRSVLQVRLDLGLLQLEVDGRPDGQRPHDFDSYFDYLNDAAQRRAKSGRDFKLNASQCSEADREFVQYFQRRVAWLALREFDRAIADANHTLAFMDFVRDHSPNDEYRMAHEQFRGFVIFHRAQAAAAAAVERNNAEAAIDAVRDGLTRIRAFLAENDLEEHADEDTFVQELTKLEQSLRELHGIDETLEEQLAKAVANEQYETAARIRDALRQRQ
jgi:UvrB/UvrC motif-containing protein